MIKDIALEIIDVDTYKCATYCEDVIAVYNVTGLIDIIYNDIDQQICRNCKHWNNKNSVCRKLNFDEPHTITSCSEFEPEVDL